MEELRVEIKKDNINYEDDVEAVLKRIIRLMQVSSNPKIIDESYNEITNRTEKTIELITEIVSKKVKNVFYGRHINLTLNI